jgi:DNA-binding transcriptional regulator YhcF (GntR family)
MGTVQVVAATIKQGILTGRFRRGSRLPSARVLSGQLRVNKNTANKAYGLLAREGLISVAAGRARWWRGRRRRVGPPLPIF